MAVSRDSRVRGGRCREGGDWGHREEARLSQDEKQVWGMWSRLEPGASVCLLTLTTAGEKTPDRTEEQGETVRLKEAGDASLYSCMADQLFSLSQPSERTDSLEEAGVGNKSAESVGLIVLSSDTAALFTKKPELTSVPREVSWHRCWEMPLCLSTAVSIEAGPAAKCSGVFSAWTLSEGDVWGRLTWSTGCFKWERRNFFFSICLFVSSNGSWR